MKGQSWQLIEGGEMSKVKPHILHGGGVLRTMVTGMPYKATASDWAWFAGLMAVFHGSGIMEITGACLDILCVLFGRRVLAFLLLVIAELRNHEVELEHVALVLNENLPELERLA